MLRMVSLAPSATSIVCSIGARRSLVGVTKWCSEVAPVQGLPVLGDCWAMGSVEEIVRLKPALVIGSVPYKAETVAKLLEHPLNFLAMNPRSLTDVYADIRLIGGILQRHRRAERLIVKMQSMFRNIQIRSGGTRPRPASRRVPRVYCEAWPHPRISSPPWVAEIVRLAGGEPVGVPGAKVSDDQIAEANPDIIVLAWAATGSRSKPQRVYSVPVWNTVNAIRHRQVHAIRDEWLNTPAPPLLEGARELARIIRKWQTEQSRKERS
jgi:iron complex transport system substrate-binding protein